LIVIFILALVVFGPRKLPELGKSVGKGLAEFKKASNELKQTWEEEVRLDKEKESISEILKEDVPLDKEKKSVSEILDDCATKPSETLENANNSVESKENK
jgi:sec-independent protein translocase protein TatA